MRNAVVIIVAASTVTGCRNPEYRFEALESRIAQGAALVDRNAVELGMGAGMVCAFSDDLSRVEEDIPVLDNKQLPDLSGHEQLLCSNQTLRILDDGDTTWIAHGIRDTQVEPAPERLVDAACLEDGWVGLTEDCTIVTDDGRSRSVAEDCGGRLRAIGPGDAVYLGATGAFEVRSGTSLGAIDDLWVERGLRLRLQGHTLTATGWTVELSTSAYAVYTVFDRVHVRHRNGTLSVLQASDGELVSVLDDPMPSGGRVLGRLDSRFAYHQQGRKLQPYQSSYGSLTP